MSTIKAVDVKPGMRVKDDFIPWVEADHVFITREAVSIFWLNGDGAAVDYASYEHDDIFTLVETE